jgi:hypothetical protein
MQLVLFFVSQYVHVVWIEHRIWQVVVIVQFREPCLFAKLPGPTFVIPDFGHPYNPT